MKNPLTLPSFGPRLLIAALAFLAAMGFAPQLHAQDAAIRGLERLEDLWGKAEVAKDADTLGALLTDDFVSIGPDGEISDKAHYLADIKASTEDYVSAGDSDRKVRIYGNAAVDTGLWTETVKTEKGPQTDRYRWSSVWIKQTDRRWLCVSTQTVHVPPAEKEQPRPDHG